MSDSRTLARSGLHDTVATVARRLRIEFPGAMYHVVCRGVERRRIFMDDADRRRFREQLGDSSRECEVRIYLYCLMPNHVHLLVETPRANLARFMHRLETGYTVYFNRRHERHGHLMQGRYRAEPVQGNEYLLKLSRYIHLNPVFVRRWEKAPLEARVLALRAYPWSSHREYTGMSPAIGFLDSEPLLRLVSGPNPDRRLAYAQYVEAGLAQSDEEFHALLHSPGWGIGDDSFRESIAERYEQQQGRVGAAEDVAFRKPRPLHSTRDVLKVVASVCGVAVEELCHPRRGCRLRALAARALTRHAGLNQRQVGRLLGIGTGAAVCQQLRALAHAIPVNPPLQRCAQEIDRRLKLDP